MHCMQFSWRPRAVHSKVLGAFSLQLELHMCERFWLWAFNWSTNIPSRHGEKNKKEPTNPNANTFEKLHKSK